MRYALCVPVLAACLFIAVPRPALAQGTAPGKQQIEQVVETFRKAIVDKDVDGFMKLFLKEDITWTVVYSDASVKRYNDNLKDATIPLATRIQGGSPRKFIESIARSKQAKSETFSNVRIDTDGEIAHVGFDYTFMVGEYKSAWGRESWQLVRTEAGWKIAAVVWSAEENPIPR